MTRRYADLPTDYKFDPTARPAASVIAQEAQPMIAADAD